jgi:protocatechuate 3,4-dioxygenase beta subunit
MKKLFSLFCFVGFLGSCHLLMAQNYASVSENGIDNYKKRNPIYDYTESQLNNVDTIPDFDTKPDKLKITGTIYQHDGKTPASDVIFYIFQADENGNYEMKRDANHKRYVYHRGWIKTNADGKYTFYTFMPGKYVHSKVLKNIHRVIKEPGKPEKEIDAFFFNDDPLLADLTIACRASLVHSMLKLQKKDDMYVVTKDIILGQNSVADQ